jgi:hypothetical protein
LNEKAITGQTQVIISGGLVNGFAERKVTRYNLRINTFRDNNLEANFLDNFPDMPLPLYEHQSIVMNSSKNKAFDSTLLVFGGKFNPAE